MPVTETIVRMTGADETIDAGAYAAQNLMYVEKLKLEGRKGVIVPGYQWFLSPYQNWDEAYLTDGAGNILTEEQVVFKPDQGIGEAGTGWPTDDVYVTGTVCDVYAAAASLLEDWANRLALEFDVSLDGNSYNRSQKSDALRAAAKEFRRKARTRVGTTERGDEAWK